MRQRGAEQSRVGVQGAEGRVNPAPQIKEDEGEEGDRSSPSVAPLRLLVFRRAGVI